MAQLFFINFIIIHLCSSLTRMFITYLINFHLSVPLTYVTVNVVKIGWKSLVGGSPVLI